MLDPNGVRLNAIWRLLNAIWRFQKIFSVAGAVFGVFGAGYLKNPTFPTMSCVGELYVLVYPISAAWRANRRKGQVFQAAPAKTAKISPQYAIWRFWKRDFGLGLASQPRMARHALCRVWSGVDGLVPNWVQPRVNHTNRRVNLQMVFEKSHKRHMACENDLKTPYGVFLRHTA
jgi:hypothetical protein